MPVVHRLHQQRPVVFAQVIEALEGAVRDLPTAVLVADQAAVHFVFHRQPGQLIRGDRIDKVFEAALENHRTFLPITLQKSFQSGLIDNPCSIPGESEPECDYNGSLAPWIGAAEA